MQLHVHTMGSSQAACCSMLNAQACPSLITVAKAIEKLGATYFWHAPSMLGITIICFCNWPRLSSMVFWYGLFDSVELVQAR